MKVKIHDLNDGSIYVAKSVEDCKDSTDKSVYQEVVSSGEVITMGKVIGEPANEISELEEILINDPLGVLNDGDVINPDYKQIDPELEEKIHRDILEND
jgi:hypothetical protein